MKKLFVFISTLFLSLMFIVNNKTYAQTEYPAITMNLPFETLYQFEPENAYTYEFIVRYRFNLSMPIESVQDINDYYMLTDYYIPLRKGLNRNSNSYALENVIRNTGLGYGIVEVRVTLNKTFVDDEFGHMYNTTPFFSDGSALYIEYISDSDSVDYDLGYSDGFRDGENTGYNRGYDHGYTEGYMDGWFDGLDQADPMAYERGYNNGYEDGLKAATSEFQTNLDKWIVPAIIIVVIAGIFVGYRRERYHD